MDVIGMFRVDRNEIDGNVIKLKKYVNREKKKKSTITHFKLAYYA